MTRAAIYLRVSTIDQTTENQEREILAYAKAQGWRVATVFEDVGISGAKTRAKRPSLDRMLNEVTAGKFDLVVCWALDRLGRSTIDVLQTIEAIHAAGADLVLLKQQLDTRTPSGKLMLGVLSSVAEFEREMIRERVRSGLARTRAKGTRLGKAPTITPGQTERLRELVEGDGMFVTDAAKAIGVTRRVAQRAMAKLRGAA
jgi:DNA invertase Pin-like site-specific DNA recombinase